MSEPWDVNPYEAPEAAVAETGVEPVEVPGTFAGNLAAAFRLLFSNLLVIVPVVLTVWLPVNVVIESIGQQSGGDVLTTFRLNQAASGVFGPVTTGAVIAVFAGRMRGRPVGYAAAMGVGLSNWGKVFAARFFAGLYILLGLILFVVPGVVLAVRYALIDPVVVLEGRGGFEARSRSRELVRGRAWSIFASAALTYVGFFAAFFGLESAVELMPAPETAGAALALNVAIDCAFDVLAVLFPCLLFVYYWDASRRQPAAPDRL